MPTPRPPATTSAAAPSAWQTAWATPPKARSTWQATSPRPRPPTVPPSATPTTRPTAWPPSPSPDRKSTRLNSSHVRISYAVFCLKKKKQSFLTFDDYLKLLWLTEKRHYAGDSLCHRDF